MELNIMRKNTMSRLTIYKDGNRRWYNEKGQLHRLNGPAIEFNNGNKFWYINGKLHREKGPASEYNEEEYNVEINNI